MMDPPRHACRGRPMVCPGPCNPLKAHHHHHHRHHHHRQKLDMTKIVTPGKDILLPDEFSQITLLKSLKTEDSVTSVTSKDDLSISTTSSSTKIAVIRIPKTSQSRKTHIPAGYISQILSPDKLEMLGQPSKPRTEKMSELIPLRKIESPIPEARTTIQPKETAARTTPYQAPRNYLNNVICPIMMRLYRLTLKIMSPLCLCLTILMIYVGIHVLLAVIARTSAYQFFMSSQICGVLAFLMWQLTGTILI
ncbi:PREDICTED: uncharacterized protein LOC108774274 [Cyphomyrmex costatus]|uniref:Uncharacterized protein n=1 Tax=Cyphomyrmex costatus TaxID=456900 RepID=A0A195CQP7_9HYME|nr:PREDICTED: uncharacterized protein LOC108774274 [Cyphomyrmex costatus]XP_018395841.1 PREDICTED: uncharacterized protein LOC108774274 [Cyphomyrmex costatus]XP_018395842.1 PREDICTED: uncharacterized protein LOC108774274 [Cyphomyrmex costatus]XP_018395843.1 PREDICTED: uncharacterized protein LOC108774274 [Cyphomyrmex costatus]KYN02434.1 hypothetical protein ALC62_06814 [Cyphomyrmex costatus]